MTGDLLRQAREQAERSTPPVRAAALMRIARVQTAVEPDQARKTFEQGLEEVRRLSGRDGEFLLQQAQCLAAAVAPDLVKDIHPTGHGMPRRFLAQSLAKIMLEHGHHDAAFEYLMEYDEPSSFPFMVLAELMKSGDATRQLALLRRAIEAWRAAPDDAFVHVFQYQWKTLPPDEALAVVREIVRVTLERPDQQVTASFDQEGTVRITSGRALALFQILHVLRRLDAPLAESLVAGHEQLAAAARRYPDGWDTIMEEAEARRKSASGESCGGYVMSGSRDDFSYLKALLQASKDGNFAPPIEPALERYREDTAPDSPNQAPREFWPSTSMFRSILYSAGKRLGGEAAVYLDRIPDSDLRLLAEIELAAALAGLPEYHGTQRQYRPRSRAAVREAEPVVEAGETTGAGPKEPRIRCPKCNWSPHADSRWSCKCGHRWNTFDTGGVCPSCLYQWKITACLRCHEWSAHSDWYTH